MFKRFRVDVVGLIWVSDLDQNGEPIVGKHKSSVGTMISWSDLASLG